jgi:hypothetical protein
VNHQSAIVLFVSLEFLLSILFAIPFAIGNGYLAPRLGKNVAVWVILTLIPLVNFFFAIYVLYKIIFALLDRSARAGAIDVPGPA